MIGQNRPVYYYPNKLSRIILMSIEEIIGHNGLNAVLNQANLKNFINNIPPNNDGQLMNFDEISRIHISLEQLYGPRGGRGLALRSGRVCFKNGLREFGEEMRINNPDFRLLPPDMKILVSIKNMAKLFNKYSENRVRVEERPERILWVVEQCPVCWNRSTDTQVCYLDIGLLQESLYWVSGGKFFNVEEIQCVAMGSATCTIAIDKTTLE